MDIKQKFNKLNYNFEFIEKNKKTIKRREDRIQKFKNKKTEKDLIFLKKFIYYNIPTIFFANVYLYFIYSQYFIPFLPVLLLVFLLVFILLQYSMSNKKLKTFNKLDKAINKKKEDNLNILNNLIEESNINIDEYFKMIEQLDKENKLHNYNNEFILYIIKTKEYKLNKEKLQRKKESVDPVSFHIQMLSFEQNRLENNILITND